MLVTFIILLSCVGSCGCRSVSSFSVLFSPGIVLQVDEDGHPPHPPNVTGSSVRPSIHLLSSVRLSEDSASPRLLVCVLTGLASPVQELLWWLDDTPVTPPGAAGPWAWAESEGGYSATSVWEVSAADWRATSSFWCGTVQEGLRYREKLCSGH